MILESGYKIALPVGFSSRQADESIAIEGEILGSAFALGGEFMLTAGHVVEQATSKSGQLVVGLSGENKYIKAAPVVEHERLDADIALLRVEYEYPGSDIGIDRLKWKNEPIFTFTPVRALGYPYGRYQVEERKQIVLRGFEGHIVSKRDEFKPTGWTGDAYPVNAGAKIQHWRV